MDKETAICVSSSSSDSDIGPMEIREGSDSDTDSAEECEDPPVSSESSERHVPSRVDSFYRLTPRTGSAAFKGRRVSKMAFANAKLSSGSTVSNVGGLIEDGGVQSMLLAFLSPPRATDSETPSTPTSFKGGPKGAAPMARLPPLPITFGLASVGRVTGGAPRGVPPSADIHAVDSKNIRTPGTASSPPSPMSGLSGITGGGGLADPASTGAEGGLISTKAVSTRGSPASTARAVPAIARGTTAPEEGSSTVAEGGGASTRTSSPGGVVSTKVTAGAGSSTTSTTSTATAKERGASAATTYTPSSKTGSTGDTTAVMTLSPPPRNLSCKNAPSTPTPSPLSRETGDGDEEEAVASLNASPILTFSASSREYIPKEYSSPDDPVKKALYDLHVLMTEGIADDNDRSHLREVRSGSLYEHTIYFIASASGHKVRSDLASKISVDVCFRSNLIENILVLSIRKAKTIELEKIKEIDKNARVVHPCNPRASSLVENNTSPHSSLRNNGHFTRLSELTNKYLKMASEPVNMFTNLKYFLCRCGVMMTNEVKCASVPHILVYDNLLVRMGLSKDSASRAVRRYKKAAGSFLTVTMIKYVHEDTIDGKRVLNPLAGHEFGKKDECVSMPIDMFLTVLYDSELMKGIVLCRHVSSFSRALSFDMIARHFIGKNSPEKDSGPSEHVEEKLLEMTARHAKEMDDLRNEMEKQNDIRIKEIKAKYEGEVEQFKRRVLKNAVKVSAETVGDLQWSIDKEIAEHKHTQSLMEETRVYAKEKEDYANSLVAQLEELKNKMKSLVGILENAWGKASSLVSSNGDNVEEGKKGEVDQALEVEEHTSRKRKREGGEERRRRRRRKKRALENDEVLAATTADIEAVAAATVEAATAIVEAGAADEEATTAALKDEAGAAASAAKDAAVDPSTSPIAGEAM